MVPYIAINRISTHTHKFSIHPLPKSEFLIIVGDCVQPRILFGAMDEGLALVVWSESSVKTIPTKLNIEGKGEK
jgi:hypothetical protein